MSMLLETASSGSRNITLVGFTRFAAANGIGYAVTPSVSSCSGFGTVGQLSSGLQTPSLSSSARQPLSGTSPSGSGGASAGSASVGSASIGSASIASPSVGSASRSIPASPAPASPASPASFGG